MHDLNKKFASSLKDSLGYSLSNSVWNSLGYNLSNSVWDSLDNSLADSLDQIVQSAQSVEETHDA